VSENTGPAVGTEHLVQSQGTVEREYLVRRQGHRIDPEYLDHGIAELVVRLRNLEERLDLDMAAVHVGTRRLMEDHTAPAHIAESDRTAEEADHTPAVVGNPGAVAEGNLGRMERLLEQDFRSHRMAPESRTGEGIGCMGQTL
jgi:hypothetical protein